MIPIYHCGNCERFSYVFRKINTGKTCNNCKSHLEQTIKLPACDGELLSQFTQSSTQERGCLFHPRTREYFMNPIIEKFEIMDGPSFGGDYVVKISCREAIEIIKKETKLHEVAVRKMSDLLSIDTDKLLEELIERLGSNSISLSKTDDYNILYGRKGSQTKRFSKGDGPVRILIVGGKG